MAKNNSDSEDFEIKEEHDASDDGELLVDENGEEIEAVQEIEASNRQTVKFSSIFDYKFDKSNSATKDILENYNPTNVKRNPDVPIVTDYKELNFGTSLPTYQYKPEDYYWHLHHQIPNEEFQYTEIGKGYKFTEGGKKQCCPNFCKPIEFKAFCPCCYCTCANGGFLRSLAIGKYRASLAGDFTGTIRTYPGFISLEGEIKGSNTRLFEYLNEVYEVGGRPKIFDNGYLKEQITGAINFSGKSRKHKLDNYKEISHVKEYYSTRITSVAMKTDFIVNIIDKKNGWFSEDIRAINLGRITDMDIALKNIYPQWLPVGQLDYVKKSTSIENIGTKRLQYLKFVSKKQAAELEKNGYITTHVTNLFMTDEQIALDDFAIARRDDVIEFSQEKIKKIQKKLRKEGRKNASLVKTKCVVVNVFDYLPSLPTPNFSLLSATLQKNVNPNQFFDIAKSAAAITDNIANGTAEFLSSSNGLVDGLASTVKGVGLITEKFDSVAGIVGLDTATIIGGATGIPPEAINAGLAVVKNADKIAAGDLSIVGDIASSI